MPALIDLVLEGRRAAHHRPWPRAIVDPEIWSFAAGQLAEGHWTLLGLWGEKDAVHMALLDEMAATIGVISLDCPDGRYPAVGQRHPPAIRLERAIRDRPEVLDCCTLTGEWDFHLRIVTHDMKEYEAFFLDHLSRIPNVQSVNSSIVVTVIKESTVLPLARS